jgi:hypothetical protein
LLSRYREALIQSFRRGLAEVIRDKIDKMRPAPNMFTEWKEEAIRRDAAFRARLVEKRAWSDHNPFRTSAPPLWNVTSTGPTQGTPNGITARAVAIPPLTTEERNRIRQEGGCVRCRQPGHLAPNCTFCPVDRRMNVSSLVTNFKALGMGERKEIIDRLGF